MLFLSTCTAKILPKYTTKSFLVPNKYIPATIFQKCHTVLPHASLLSLFLLIISSMNSSSSFQSLFYSSYSLNLSVSVKGQLLPLIPLPIIPTLHFQTSTFIYAPILTIMFRGSSLYLLAQPFTCSFLNLPYTLSWCFYGREERLLCSYG